MIDNSKKSKDVEGAQFVSGKLFYQSTPGLHSMFNKSDALIPMGTGVIQIMFGLILVAVSVLGLVTPLWLSTFLSMAGSVSCLAGIFLVYHVLSAKGSFESLINQAIRRVISAQN